MKSTILLILLCATQFAFSQISLQDIESELKKEYSAEDLGEFINLAAALPMKVPVDIIGSEDWIAARQKCVELYLIWYQKMFASRFALDAKSSFMASEASIALLETEEQKQSAINMNARNTIKNNAVSSFLIAEQRLKYFTKKSFKAKKRQKIKEMLLSYTDSYDTTIEKILDDVLVREVGFTVYENRVSKD